MFGDSIYDKSQIEFQEKLNNEVLCYLPESIRKFSPRYFGKSQDEPLTAIQGLLPDENHHFYGSEYYDEPTGIYAHFTSEESACSIIKSGNLRMYNLYNSNDDNELSGVSRQFDYGQEQIRVLKSQIFTLSITKVSNGIIHEDFEHHWKVYGDRGKGVALLFRFVNHPLKWKNYHFSRIKYEPASWISPFANAIQKWNKNNPHYYAHIPKLLSFHKSVGWEAEREYRLLYNGYFNFNDDRPYPSNSHSGRAKVGSEWIDITVPIMHNSEKDIYFIELPINKTSLTSIEKNYFEYSPLIELVGFAIGTKNKDAQYCTNLLSNLTKEYLGYSL